MKKILSVLILCIITFTNAQTELVFVFFKDKPNKAAFYTNPLSELSQKSLDRRTNLGIPLNDQDAPIEPNYIQNIKNLGFTVTDYSKWMNGVAVNATSAQITQLSQQSYVDHVESFVKNPNGGKQKSNRNKFEKFNQEFANKSAFNYGTGAEQIDQINLRTLHEQGFTGNGITIAMLDTGFPTVNTGSVYSRLRNSGKIKGGYNFISKNTDIYNTSLNSHGAICLGSIAGFIDGQFVGSAPDAEFYLYATESGPQEIPEEELYWIEGAEDADRKGVDLISASLGYADFFDDTRYNYTYEDMTGSKSFVARGAQIATEKGIIVMVAAGNEGNGTWHYIITPADNTKVFTVGAVDSSGNSSGFSSFGPNYSGAIKPDASARGTSTATVYNNSTTSASGTSLSTPVAAGGVACLLQAIPKTFSRETAKDLLRQEASLAPSYNFQMGYGILNFGEAYTEALLTTVGNNTKSILKIHPNPVKSTFTITTDEKIISVELYDVLGRKVQSLSNVATQNIDRVNKGVYFVKIKTEKNEYIEKIIKQ